MLWDGTPDVKLAPLRERVSRDEVIARKGLLSYRRTAASGKTRDDLLKKTAVRSVNRKVRPPGPD
jgi:hypothetical protein